MSKQTDISSIAELYPFKPKVMDLDGLSCSYVDEGVGEPVLMVHGNPSWSFLYRNLILALRGSRRVIAPDHIGCGLSDKPQDFDYTLASHVANLEKFVRMLGLRDITLVVHDWGGPIGLGVAGRNPDLFKRIIITNTAAFPFSRIPARINVCRAPVLGEFMMRRLNLFCIMAQYMTTEKPMPADVRRGYILPYSSYADRIAVARFVQDIPMGPSARSYEALLGIEGKLGLLKDKDIHIIWGMRD